MAIEESWISMETYKALFGLFFLYLHSVTASDEYCPTSYCGQSFTQVRFPFRLIDQQPQNCGFPGFDLRCAFPSMLLINIPGSGEFSVRSIDYRSPAIQIYDRLNCLPARLLTFDLSNSPFSASYFRNFTLLSCPTDARISSGLKPIDCFGNSSVLVFASDSKTLVTSMTSNQTGCVITGQLRVPVDQPYDDDGFTSQLDEDITLTWTKPGCAKCEAIGDSCGYVNSNTKRIKCFSNLAAPRPSGIFRIIVFTMAIPVIIACVMIACVMGCKDRRNDLNRRTTLTAVTPEEAIAPPNIVGLDQTTIESYTKVVLGESKRLPGHDDAACPICLAEYHVEETVRCIPECRHCFHAECIDEWLKMNGSCPVCRNSPSPVHVEP